MANGLLNSAGTTPRTAASNWNDPDIQGAAKQLYSAMQTMTANGDEAGAKRLYNEKQKQFGFTDEQFSPIAQGANGASYTAPQISQWKENPETTVIQTQPYEQPSGTGTTLNANASALPEAKNDLSNLTGDYAFQQGRDAAFNQAKSRLDPQFQTAQRNLENQLTQQGIMRGSEAWNREVDNFSRDRNDAYGSAWNNAWNNGLQGQNQNFTQDFSNRSLRQQGQIANRGLDLQSRSIDNQFALGNRGLDLQGRSLDQQNNQFNQTYGLQRDAQTFNQGLARDQFGLQQQNQTWNQGFQRDQFDYRKFNDDRNINTARSNGDRNGLFGLGAAALTNPAVITMLRNMGGDFVDGLGKVTAKGMRWLSDQQASNNNPDYSNEGRNSTAPGVTTDYMDVPAVYQDSSSPTGYVDARGEWVFEDGTPVGD